MRCLQFISTIVLSLLGIAGCFCQDGQTVYTGQNVCSQNLFIKSALFKNYPGENYSNFKKLFIRDNFSESYPYLLEEEKIVDLIELEKYAQLEGVEIFHLKINDTLHSISINFASAEFSLDFDRINDNDFLFIENVISDSLGFDYQGVTSQILQNPVVVDFIKNLTFQKGEEIIQLTHNELKHFINPNRYFLWRGLKPIRAFYSESQKRMIIYVYGALDYSFNKMHENSIASSYLLKIEFDIYHPDDFLLSFIPGRYLVTYGWLSCEMTNQIWEY
ncbi:MAG: hypothetical protein IPL49_19015 [Saprospirales bacterium]|nr:hypothetical protein [Saprospirales bacterium]MBK8492915.1 hypothetical protein [Saprospirales bacterium]